MVCFAANVNVHSRQHIRVYLAYVVSLLSSMKNYISFSLADNI